MLPSEATLEVAIELGALDTFGVLDFEVDTLDLDALVVGGAELGVELVPPEQQLN